TELAVGSLEKISLEVHTETSGKVVVDRLNNHRYRCLPVENRLTQDNHGGQKWKKRDEDIGGDGEGINMDLGLKQRAQRRPSAGPERFPGVQADGRTLLEWIGTGMRIRFRRYRVARLHFCFRTSDKSYPSSRASTVALILSPTCRELNSAFDLIGYSMDIASMKFGM